jgi:hypothetical protein
MAIGIGVSDWREFDAEAYRRDGGPMADEMATYAERLEELLPREGQFVVIKGNDIAGVYPTLDAALEASAEKFGRERALIQRIERFETIFPTNGLAL